MPKYKVKGLTKEPVLPGPAIISTGAGEVAKSAVRIARRAIRSGKGLEYVREKFPKTAAKGKIVKEEIVNFAKKVKEELESKLGE